MSTGRHINRGGLTAFQAWLGLQIEIAESGMDNVYDTRSTMSGTEASRTILTIINHKTRWEVSISSRVDSLTPREKSDMVSLSYDNIEDLWHLFGGISRLFKDSYGKIWPISKMKTQRSLPQSACLSDASTVRNSPSETPSLKIKMSFGGCLFLCTNTSRSSY